MDGGFMRRAICVLLPIVLSGCNSLHGAKEAANEEYAVDSYEQSVAAYQLCAAENKGDPDKCSALARVLEADRKRYDKLSAGQ
jgi:hypothetical protein